MIAASTRRRRGVRCAGQPPRVHTTARHDAGRKEGTPNVRTITCRCRAHRLRAERGQGTVEYVGIVLAVAALLVAVAAAIDNKVGGPIATALVHRLQEAVAQVGNAKHG